MFPIVLLTYSYVNQLIGFMKFGSGFHGFANLFSGHESLDGNARALATVTGIIDGVGSVGGFAWIHLFSCHFETKGIPEIISVLFLLFCFPSFTYLPQVLFSGPC